MLSVVVRAQNISEIAKSDPLIITGAVGTQNTYRYMSGGASYASPLSNMFYANLNISLYGISMPFSFYYTNDNTSFSYPTFSFNLTPTYKNWIGHFGQSSMQFSNYVMTTSFNGVGLEYRGKKLRLGAFYGTLRKAINDDPTDPFARVPQYKRIGWGFTAGYGSGRNTIDLYLLRAYDAPNTIDEGWRTRISPQENLVVGLKGATAPLRWLSFTANVAASAFSTDATALKVDNDEAKRWGSIFETKYSSLMRFAGDASMRLNLGGVNAAVTYRYIQPNYISLGTNYMSNNYHALALTAGTMLFKKISLAASFSGQQDNLSGEQLYTTRGLVYNAHLSTHLGQHFSLALGYNGYTQQQHDGTAHVNDTTRIDRQLHSFSLTPSYNVETNIFGHNISASVNYTANLDKNIIAAKKNDIKTKALGLNYTLDIKPWEVDVTGSYSHQETEGYRTKYTSDIIGIDLGRSFLAERNLSVNAGINWVYNHVYRQSKSLSMGGQLSASYTLKKVHAFSASAYINKYGDVNMSETRSGLDDTDISVSLNYAYTFSLFSILSKAHKEEAKKKQ